jgi:hypothetical protein
MNQSTTSAVLAGLAALLLSNAAAAATTPAAEPEGWGVKVDMNYDASANERAPVRYPAGTCPVHIVRAVDARQNRETIGADQHGALLADDLSPWLTAGLMQLKQYGYAVQEDPAGSPAAADGITVRASVTRAYTWQIGLKIFGMVAVKAEFLDHNGVLQQKYYRAHGDKTNMVGADDEHVTTLNYGLNNMLAFVADDLQSLCQGRKVAEYSYAGPNGLPAK